MAQNTSDNIRCLAPKQLDDNVGIWTGTSWRPFNDINEFNTKFVLAARFVNQTFWVKSTVDPTKASLWALDTNKDPYSVFTQADLTDYYTKSEINGLLTTESGDRVDGDLVNANAIAAETTRAIGIENTKLDKSDSLVPITIDYSNLISNAYTNILLANKSITLIYNDDNGTHLVFITANGSGTVTMPFTAYAGFKGVIQGTSVDLANYVKNSYLFDVIIGKNKFNKDNVITGFYVNGLGNLVANAPSRTSQWIPIDNTLAYNVSGRSTGNVRFRNSSGTILPPNNSDGSPRTDYTTAPSGSNNGILYPPTGATDVQFSAILNTGTMDAIQLEVGTVATTYAPYTESYFIKTALIPTLPYVTSTVLNAGLDLKVDKSFLLYDQIGKNKFDKTKNIVGKYINPADGSLQNSGTSQVSDWIPIKEGVPYYLSGRTTGAVRLKNAAGTILQNNNANGTPRTDWGTAPSGSNDGIIYPPSGATHVQFTSVLSGSGNINIQQLEEGTSPTSYEAFISTPLVKTTVLTPSANPSATFKVIKSANRNDIRTYFDEIYDIIISLTTGEYNGLYNISSAYLLLKSDEDKSIGTQLNGAGSDDSAPTFFNGQIYGGDHAGASYKLTATVHGKTIGDVGAVYTDVNLHRYIIFRIDDANNLTVVVENISPSSWSFPAPVGPLTYTSNGNDPTTITFTASVLVQLYPSIKNVIRKTILDGKEYIADGTYYGDKLSFIESYDIVDYVDFVAKLISQRPVGGYLVQPLTSIGDTIVKVTTYFEVQAKGTIAMQNTWVNNKSIILDYFGITQSGYITPVWATTVKKYMPKVLPIVNNGNTYDFRLMPEFKTPVVTGEILLTNSYWENAKVPNRSVDLLQSSGLNVNFNMGYLPVGADRATTVTTAWRITSNKKAYPRFIDAKLNVSGSLPVNTIKQGVMFRGWSIPSGIRTNDILIESGGKYYLNLDYHVVGTDTFYLPPIVDGKSVTVIDKTANVTLLTPIVSGCIMIQITTASPMYGYCELLIS
jgi:hypothetical protein